MGRVRRTTELGLIVLGSLIITGAYTLASLGRNASVPADVGPFLGIILALLVSAHLATRWLAPDADGLLLPLAALLNGLGFVFIVRLAGERRVPENLPGLQSTWTALGIAAYVGTLLLVRKTKMLDQYRYTFALLGIGLLMVPLIPGIGRQINGARIWASIGPINFQPGEFAKIVLAIFFASYLVEKRELLRIATTRLGPIHLPELRHLGPLLLAWGASIIVMVLEKDLGSSLLFFALFAVMVWVATDRIAYLISALVMFMGGAYVAWTQFTHVQARVDIWLDPWADPSNKGFQVLQSMFAFASGGITGTGLGLGDPERIPEVQTDFIFAAIGEELGLFGATAVLLCYLLMIGSGLRVAMRAESAFDKLLAVGLTALLGIQTFIIIGGVTRLVPLTGITLPFVSYGGSSLLANYVLLALLMRISDETAKREKLRAEQPGLEQQTVVA